MGRDRLPLAELHQCPFRLFAKWVIEFRGIDPRNTDMGLIDYDGVAIYDPASPLQDDRRLVDRFRCIDDDNRYVSRWSPAAWPEDQTHQKTKQHTFPRPQPLAEYAVFYYGLLAQRLHVISALEKRLTVRPVA